MNSCFAVLNAVGKFSKKEKNEKETRRKKKKEKSYCAFLTLMDMRLTCSVPLG